MSRGHKGVRQSGLSMQVKDRSVQDLMKDIAEFSAYLDKIGAGAPRCIAQGCPRKISDALDPYYCALHRPRR